MTGSAPLERATRLRTAAAADPDAVDPDDVLELLRYPVRAVQRPAADALLSVVTAFPEVGRDAVSRLAHLLDTLDETAPDDEPRERRIAFGETLLLCLSRIAAAHPADVAPVRDSVVDRLNPAGGDLNAAASICLVQLVSGDPGLWVGEVDLFAKLLDADDDATRRHAAHALSEIAEEHPAAVAPALPAMEEACSAEDEEILKKVTATLGRLAWADAETAAPCLPAVTPLLDHEDVAVRANAVGTVADIAADCPGDVAPHLDAVTDLLDDADPRVRRNATATLARVAAANEPLPTPIDGGLMELLDDPDMMVRTLACRAIGYHEVPAALELLRPMATDDPEAAVREAAQWAIDRSWG